MRMNMRVGEYHYFGKPRLLCCEPFLKMSLNCTDKYHSADGV